MNLLTTPTGNGNEWTRLTWCWIIPNPSGPEKPHQLMVMKWLYPVILDSYWCVFFLWISIQLVRAILTFQYFQGVYTLYGSGSKIGYQLQPTEGWSYGERRESSIGISNFEPWPHDFIGYCMIGRSMGGFMKYWGGFIIVSCYWLLYLLLSIYHWLSIIGCYWLWVVVFDNWLLFLDCLYLLLFL